MADIPVHLLLLQLAQHQVPPMAIIAPLYSSSINEPVPFRRLKNSKQIDLRAEAAEIHKCRKFYKARPPTLRGPRPESYRACRSPINNAR